MSVAVPVYLSLPSLPQPPSCIICLDGSNLINKSSYYRCNCKICFFHKECFDRYEKKFNKCPTCSKIQGNITVAVPNNHIYFSSQFYTKYDHIVFVIGIWYLITLCLSMSGIFDVNVVNLLGILFVIILMLNALYIQTMISLYSAHTRFYMLFSIYELAIVCFCRIGILIFMMAFIGGHNLNKPEYGISIYIVIMESLLYFLIMIQTKFRINHYNRIRNSLLFSA